MATTLITSEIPLLAYSDPAVNQGALSGTATASFSDMLLFTGGSGPGVVRFTVEYSLRVASESCDQCIGNAKVTFNDLSRDFPCVVGQMTDLYYSFTYCRPLPISMSAFAFSSAEFHENDAQSLATLSLDSVVIIPEPRHSDCLLY